MYPLQVRQVVLPASEATGPCKARALAQQLWEGEEYHLQASRCPAAAPPSSAPLPAAMLAPPAVLAAAVSTGVHG